MKIFYNLTLLLLALLTISSVSVVAQKSDKRVAPYGVVKDAVTGRPIPNAVVSLYNSSKAPLNPIVEKTDSSGKFRFEENSDIKIWYRITVSASGYGSKRVDQHTSYGNLNAEVKLQPVGNFKVVSVPNEGVWLYKKSDSGYSYIDGESTNNDDFFFPETSDADIEAVEALKEKMGLVDRELSSDREIYDEFAKIWNFWSSNKRNLLKSADRLSAEEKAGKDYLYKISPYSRKRWPTVGEYANCYHKYGFLPEMNCSGTTIMFANLLTLTTIPPERMAIEVMHPNKSASGEHWSVILKIKEEWHWFDPLYTSWGIKGFESLKPTPWTNKSMSYDKPFKIYRFRGDSKTEVPLCVPLI